MDRQIVSVVPVTVRRSATPPVETPLFQASGWVEPRPTPILVSALTEGVVEELLVVEGQPIAKGEPVARLMDVDAKLDLRQAETTLQLRKAELQCAEAELRAAKLHIENPVHLEVALADAESHLAQTRASLVRLPHQIIAAEGRALFAEQNYRGKQAAERAIAGRLIQEALSDYTDATAQLSELKQRAPLLHDEEKALKRKVEALKSQMKLMIDESRQLEYAQAQLEIAKSRLAEAQLAVERAQLRLDRTLVRSPAQGVVLSLVASPGARVMGAESASEQDSSTVITMYDPEKLQVRAEVSLDDVALVHPGQPVEIKTSSSTEPISGTVLLSALPGNSQTGILHVKVAIDQPPRTIRPDMPVTTTFLTSASMPSQEAEMQEREQLLIPRELIVTDGEDHFVWLVTDDHTAELQKVTLGDSRVDHLVEVIAGIDAASKLIATGQGHLKPGMDVMIAEESRMRDGYPVASGASVTHEADSGACAN